MYRMFKNEQTQHRILAQHSDGVIGISKRHRFRRKSVQCDADRNEDRNR